MEEFEKFEKSVKDQLQQMKSKFQEVLKENAELKDKLKKMDDSGSSDDLEAAAEFSIDVGEGGSTTATESKKKRKAAADPSYNIPTTSGSSSGTTKSSSQTKKPSKRFSEKDLDELLQTDPLSRSVYEKLKPLGTIKTRVLAMQMGISQQKCQTAIERLMDVGAVQTEGSDQVKAIEK